MRTLDYQVRVLDTLDAYLDALKPEKARAEKIAAMAEADPDLGLEVPLGYLTPVLPEDEYEESAQAIRLTVAGSPAAA